MTARPNPSPPKRWRKRLTASKKLKAKSKRRASNIHRKCPNCKEWRFFGAQHIPDHKCAPAWECRLGWQDDDDWQIVHAQEPKDAAEKYAERYDCEGGEYVIVSQCCDNPIVLVRKIGAETSERWAIEAESVPHYRAHALTGARKP